MGETTPPYPQLRRIRVGHPARLSAHRFGAVALGNIRKGERGVQE